MFTFSKTKNKNVQTTHQFTKLFFTDPEKDIYAIPSRASSQKREIYFLALVDILTQYGVKKQAAKVAKTVKYGAKDVEGISTVEPEQYHSRFLEFMSNAIE